MSSIAREVAEAVTDKLAGWYMDDASDVLREDYSGRGMYGTTCVGFIAEPAMVIAAFAQAIAENPYLDWDYDLMQFANEARTDSIGTGTITYFPGLKIIED